VHTWRSSVATYLCSIAAVAGSELISLTHRISHNHPLCSVSISYINSVLISTAAMFTHNLPPHRCCVPTLPKNPRLPKNTWTTKTLCCVYLANICALKSTCNYRRSRHRATNNTTHNHFTALSLGPPGWAGARRELLDITVQGKITEADTPTIRLGTTHLD